MLLMKLDGEFQRALPLVEQATFSIDEVSISMPSHYIGSADRHHRMNSHLFSKPPLDT